MPSRKRAKRSYSRRFLLLSVLIVLAILAYTGGWFYAANLLETRTIALMDKLNLHQRRASCEEPSARGYPFRIGLFCRSVFYEDGENGISVSAGAFRSAAQVYEPLRTVGELDGPARISIPFLPPLEADWEEMRMSARLTATELPQRLSSETHKLVLTLEEPENSGVATAEDFQAHTRRNGADVDVALVVKRLALDPAIAGEVPVPPLDGEMLVTVTDGVALIEQRNPSLRGRSGRIGNLILKTSDENASIALQGPVEIDPDGLINAELNVTVTEPQTVARLIADAFPQQRDQIEGVIAGLSGLGNAPTLPVNIRQGRVFVGFLPIARIPPVR